jgi:Lactoylglutathione lyase and related lyases
MFKRIDHIELIPSDIEKSIDFYVHTLNFKIKTRKMVNLPDMFPLKEVVYLELGDTVLELMSVENPSLKSSQPWITGYRAMALEVEDMEKATEYLKSKGVEMTWGPLDLGNSVRAEFKDVDGFDIELRQWK